MDTMKVWMVTGKDHCGFSVKAKTAEEAVKRARRYRGFSRIERPILCVRLFCGK